MFFSIILTYLPYALVTAFTPGPNNILSLQAAAEGGWRQSRRVLAGIGGGFLAVMTLTALFCHQLSQYLPAVAGGLKYLGAAYILWLAFHIAFSKPGGEARKSASFWRAFALQFVNVKIYLYAITVYTGYVLPHSTSLPALLLHGLCLAVIGLLGCTAWATAGGLLQKFILRFFRPFNIIMGAILVYCAIRMLI